jgi:hypothetical protein
MQVTDERQGPVGKTRPGVGPKREAQSEHEKEESAFTHFTTPIPENQS